MSANEEKICGFPAYRVATHLYNERIKSEDQVNLLRNFSPSQPHLSIFSLDSKFSRSTQYAGKPKLFAAVCLYEYRGTMPTRKQHVHSEEWSDIRQLCLWKEQLLYERIRPVVLFGDTPAERAQQTEAQERTLRRQTERFDQEGMLGLFRQPPQLASEDHRTLPPPVRQFIVDVRLQYPDLGLREMAQICFVQWNRRPSHHTIKAIIANGPAPTTLERWYPFYEHIADGFQRRKIVVT